MATTRTQARPRAETMQQPAGGAVAVYQPRLAMPAEASDFGVDAQAWRVLVDATFPAAKSAAAVMMALAYCKERGLDPFKRPVHIVPVWSSEKQAEIETVWPGISELRTTGMRTGAYAGMDAAAWGPDKSAAFKSDKGEQFSVTYPEWCQVTVYRLVGAHRVPFPGPRVYWMETYAHEKKRSEAPNYMWRQRPRQQLEKCAEAAALRRAFPEELGGEYAAEEMEGQTLESVTVQAQHVPTQAAVQQIQEQQAQDATYVYEVILDGGEVRETQDPAEALVLIAEAIKAPGADPAGVWESNAPILDVIGKLGEKAASNVARLAELRDATAAKKGAPADSQATEDLPAFLWRLVVPKDDKTAEYLAEQIMVKLDPYDHERRAQWYAKNAEAYVALSDRLTKMGSPLASALKQFFEGGA